MTPSPFADPFLDFAWRQLVARGIDPEDAQMAVVNTYGPEGS